MAVAYYRSSAPPFIAASLAISRSSRCCFPSGRETSVAVCHIDVEVAKAGSRGRCRDPVDDAKGTEVVQVQRLDQRLVGRCGSILTKIEHQLPCRPQTPCGR